ncbi:MAG: ATP-binding protein [Deltaproteobacteria bacterium]|nr:ATP-binding protein [Deltaproteobacteria bacterium]
MQISVASGKGGTGKTTIATSLALSVDNTLYVDCDVEEPNGHIFLDPRITERVSGGIPVPRVDESLCTHCGLCADVCEYHAIVVIKDKVLLFSELCHGCGGCTYMCPVDAIEEVEREIGIIEKGIIGAKTFLQARLNIGEPMAPPLIRKEKTFLDHDKTIIIDAPPGTSCPVVQAISGTDFCVLVTEPTPFGLHDLTLAVEMVRVLGIPAGVIVNLADIGNKDVWTYCEREGLPILMEIPFDRRIAEAYSRGIPLVNAFPEYKEKFSDLYHTIRQRTAS